jgi:predicted CXXCH cytochrome family protein
VGKRKEGETMQALHKTARRHLFIYVLMLGALAATSIGIVSCTSVERTVLAPPHVAGATFEGSDSCTQCHENQAGSFASATHSWIQGSGPHAVDVGCESCHGPGSIHIESGGAYGTIVNPGRSPETCFQCHVDKLAEFRLPNRHPVLEGQIGCVDCHSPHEGSMIAGGDISLVSQNDTCLQCHNAQRGPYVFEHEALRDGCTTCHSPHGSVNAKMLVARNSNLCLQCHSQHQTTADQIMIGTQNHTGRVAQGTCWSSGCHEAVHGSFVSERLRY